MLDLSFAITHAAPARESPGIVFALEIVARDSRGAATIERMLVNCQLRFEPARRNGYDPEGADCRALFGEPSQWAQTMRSIPWTTVRLDVPRFQGRTSTEVVAPCPLEANLAAARYLRLLDSGAAPVAALFSGTSFYLADDGRLQMAPISWSQQASFPLAIEVWREAVTPLVTGSLR